MPQAGNTAVLQSQPAHKHAASQPVSSSTPSSKARPRSPQGSKQGTPGRHKRPICHAASLCHSTQPCGPQHTSRDSRKHTPAMPSHDATHREGVWVTCMHCMACATLSTADTEGAPWRTPHAPSTQTQNRPSRAAGTQAAPLCTHTRRTYVWDPGAQVLEVRSHVCVNQHHSAHGADALLGEKKDGPLPSHCRVSLVMQAARWLAVRLPASHGCKTRTRRSASSKKTRTGSRTKAGAQAASTSHLSANTGGKQQQHQHKSDACKQTGPDAAHPTAPATHPLTDTTTGYCS